MTIQETQRSASAAPAADSPERRRDGRRRWQERYDEAVAKGRIRTADFTTLSGVEVDPVYGPTDEQAAADERMDRIGWPGEFPLSLIHI